MDINESVRHWFGRCDGTKDSIERCMVALAREVHDGKEAEMKYEQTMREIEETRAQLATQRPNEPAPQLPPLFYERTDETDT